MKLDTIGNVHGLRVSIIDIPSAMYKLVDTSESSHG